jgi:hypothetical protein
MAEIFILYNFDVCTSNLNVELALTAKNNVDFIKKISVNPVYLQIIHELMIVTDYEIEFEELENSAESIINDWLEINVGQIGISSFRLS